MGASFKDLLHDGDTVQVTHQGQLVDATYTGEWNDKYDLAAVIINGKRFLRNIKAIGGQPVKHVSHGGQKPASAGAGLPATVKRSRFDVNTRFGFIENVVDMVVSGESKSVIISGSGGLGKTFTVFHRLREAGLENVDDFEENEMSEELGLGDLQRGDYKVVKGFTAPKALYRLLYNFREKLIVFDDCDSVWAHPVTLSLLKAALDSYDTRRLSWLTEMQRVDDDLPNSFEFTGKIIFVSNLSLGELDQAVLSRCLYVDVSMTSEEKIARIKAISGNIREDMTRQQKDDAIELLDSHKDNIGDLNIRTFLKVLEIQHANPTNWRDLAEYVITAM